jgi:5-methylcytosine-specific restriction enzyme subunit McrC
MSVDISRIIELTEYDSRFFPRAEISEEVGEFLWRDYSQQVIVDFPSPKTGGQWKLTAQGWVGYLPLPEGRGLALQPRVELSSLFRMLEYAYRLKSFKFLEGLFDSRSLEEFYERLALVLARRILDCNRKGLYRAYLSTTEQLPYVTGRLDIPFLIQKPWDVRFRCHYQEHTADIEENQILAWTLYTIIRSGLCTDRVLPTVRRAHHLLQGSVALRPYSPQACVGRLYNRLNEDYQPLHALCRFFLENSGPSHQVGDRKMLPFMVNMTRLYELFVAEWLLSHLPASWKLKVQEQFNIGDNNTFSFNIDLVLYDANTGLPRCVLDTKYKTAAGPTTDDISQVVAYAEAKGCHEAILIYPLALGRPLDGLIGDIHVHSMTFSLTGDLHQAGQDLVRRLLSAE